MADKYLFLFTIRPVQSFIAEARKTKDLYAGSRLLSDLIDSAIKDVKKYSKVEIIFPDENIASKPNRFIAIVNTENPKDFAKNIESCVRKNFKNIANDLFKSCFNEEKVNKPVNFDNQINDFLEIFWVMKPYKDNYYEIYEKIEQELGAIKNVRVFNQLKETGRKCSLCGKRNALFYKKIFDKRKNQYRKPAYIQNDALEITKCAVLAQGEGLCAVCFVKRFYKDISFPSTAGISSLDWVNKIEKSKIKEYKALLENFDEQLFYEDNLRKEYLMKYNHLKDTTDIEKAKRILKKFYKDFGKPTSYYALLMLDGDNMGKWLSGEFLDNKMGLKDFHNKISKELGEYAKKVANEIITDHKGKLVYAGGDDVMAFINLNYLFNVMKKLREKFPQFENLGFPIKTDIKSSASAGVVIAHYKTPLSEVLKWARKMEHEAKEIGKRDSFGIAVLKHSGEIHKTVYKWLGEERWIVDMMKELVNELNDDNNGFSNNFIKTLQEEFRKMEDIPHERMLSVELKRLISRSSKCKEKSIKEEKTKKLFNDLETIYINTNNKENFFSFLNIADFIAREVKGDN